MNGESAFGVDHGGEISKAEEENRRKKQVAIGAGVAGTGAVGTAAVLGGTRMPEHTHYSAKTRKHLHKLPAGEHEVPIKMLMDRPRKLGHRQQQRSYVAAMAQERPLHTYSPVPVVRYKGKGNPVIQRDNAHSVMAHAMKGRKTVKIKIEDAKGYRPTRMTGEELVRRGQARYQQKRLKAHHNIGNKRINQLVDEYTPASRKSNTEKRPHGKVEEGFKMSKKPYGVKQAVNRPSLTKLKTPVATARKIVAVKKRDDRRGHDVAAAATGAAGVGTLAATPVRRSAAKVSTKGGQMTAHDVKRVASPGYRPGNKQAIRVMAANMGHLEDKPTTVIRYKDGRVIPFDGNHRATARVARGDKKIPVNVIQGKERPSVSVAQNVYHVARQRLHREQMERGAFTPVKEKGSNYTPKHRAEAKSYKKIANASPIRSGTREAIEGSKFAAGPTKQMLRTRQGATVAAGTALLGTAGILHHQKKS